MMDPGFGYSSFESTMFTLVPSLIAVGFVAVIGMMIVSAVRGTAQWHRNNQSPRLTVEAEVVSRRTDVSTFHHGGHDGDAMCHTTASTTYYLCHLPGGQRRPDGVCHGWGGVRASGRGGPGPADLPGHPLPGL